MKTRAKTSKRQVKPGDRKHKRTTQIHVNGKAKTSKTRGSKHNQHDLNLVDGIPELFSPPVNSKVQYGDDSRFQDPGEGMSGNVPISVFPVNDSLNESITFLMI